MLNLSQLRCLLCRQDMKTRLSWKTLLVKEEKPLICEGCIAQLEPLSGELCRICSKILEEEYRVEDLCLDCHRWELDEEWKGFLKENHSLFRYNEYLKETIAKFKYRGDYAIADAFGGFMKSALEKIKFDIVVAIPLSKERLQERGFNQAQALAEKAGQPCEEWITRIHSEKQSKKTRHERISSAQVFEVIHSDGLNGKSILLVDDIYTTGSTLRHAAKVLKRAGAKEIKSITLAR